MLSLSDCFNPEKRLDAAIFVYDVHNQPITWGDFRRDVGKFANFLISQSYPAVLLCCGDSYLFRVAFFAIMMTGQNIVIPSNLQSETIQTTAQTLNAVCITDAVVQNGLTHIETMKDGGSLLPLTVANQIKITLFTSGSTNQPTPVTKPVSAFEEEVHDLHLLWENAVKDAVIVSSVPPHHTYGLLFSVLWPMCAGRPVMLNRILYPDDLERVCLYKKAVFVSSPAFLHPFSSVLTSETLTSACLSLITSSGSPLDETTAKLLEPYFPNKVYEIYGSTETGGIATRQQVQNTRWQCLPKVRFSLDPQTECLSIQSPYTGQGEAWVNLADCAESVQGQPDMFLLKGRKDRTVKVHEKRVCLETMEKIALNHPFIQHIRILFLENDHRLAVVAVLTPSGQEIVKTKGRSFVIKTLKHHLQGFFEADVLPRKWRFVERMPVNDMGKLTLHTLQALFDKETTPHE